MSKGGNEGGRAPGERARPGGEDQSVRGAAGLDLEQDEASHIGLQWQAGLGDGRLRAMARTPVYHGEAVRALERLRRRAENLGGSLVVERAPAEIKNEIDSWGSFGSAMDLMKRIKQQLDPENLLSPGRFVV